MLTVSNITKVYGKKTVLNNVSFKADDGRCIGFIGMNGTGKSTLLSIIAGIEKPTHGTVDAPVCGYVPQSDPLIEELSVKDNLRLWYHKSGLNMKEELQTGILKLLGINEFINSKVSKISGGMKKRVSIGIAMADNPSVLILDEPNNGLDIKCRNDITDYLIAYKNKGGTVLLATHDMEQLSVCDTVYLLENGKISEVKEINYGKYGKQ